MVSTPLRTRYPHALPAPTPKPPALERSKALFGLRPAPSSLLGISKERAQVLQPLVDPPQVVVRTFLAQGVQDRVLGVDEKGLERLPGGHSTRTIAVRGSTLGAPSCTPFSRPRATTRPPCLLTASDERREYCR